MTDLSNAERRARIVSGIRAETGISEAMIDALVERFYGRVRKDPLLGPIFAERIADWGPHLATMKRFWSSVTLMSGTYHGQPMQKHFPLPIDRHHFDRWLALFKATAIEVCPLPAARHFMERADRIAESLEIGIASGRGVILRKGERYERPADAA
ncbi:MAG TPA: group III truncated hemoglobin [Alphaproteobacteria bacterium]|jgi:hemoglobin|nr:group III truncated hemoglobin [Alphaproteobacteria bacterium]